ncbi:MULTISPECIES: muconolactone Delta-isomerase [Sphingobium]|jgi:muconolactone D-isomerase|uniref:Muconolactone Delta-isomerase n=2 Tax=Sphingobium fuliginis (strain ATCC 27551) TaxID=336203 RepID=A0A292ZKM1_SPHSA|nr:MULTISPECIES: muconolactone Delta-isomerase [Sphingobium]AJR23655.1 muconolactone delta-isomerase [Sphingobium sp. YBL2]QDC39509.1 muconolactone Delta-isomerase [Sphingobium fuliginis ATCC 27551]QOT73813.1 muconolactone Delta-isomerase [Sphingobium fuliginis]GAY23977.1 muconolactone isomerase [Sphingobium fuliginis]
MLFHVTMDVHVPHGCDPARFEQLKAAEKARFQQLQRDGTWRHIWRVVGRYSNVSIFDVEDNAQLHDLLTSLPLYPFMEVKVTALCRHPSSLHDDDR